MPPNPDYRQSGWIKSEPAGQRTNMRIATYSIRHVSETPESWQAADGPNSTFRSRL